MPQRWLPLLVVDVVIHRFVVWWYNAPVGLVIVAHDRARTAVVEHGDGACRVVAVVRGHRGGVVERRRSRETGKGSHPRDWPGTRAPKVPRSPVMIGRSGRGSKDGKAVAQLVPPQVVQFLPQNRGTRGVERPRRRAVVDWGDGTRSGGGVMPEGVGSRRGVSVAVGTRRGVVDGRGRGVGGGVDICVLRAEEGQRHGIVVLLKLLFGRVILDQPELKSVRLSGVFLRSLMRRFHRRLHKVKLGFQVFEALRLP